MKRIKEIEDIIKYLEAMRKHTKYVSNAMITTTHVSKFERPTIEITFDIPYVDLDKWLKEHDNFFNDGESTETVL